MNRLKKLAIPSLLLAGIAMSPLVLAESPQHPFDGRDVNVKFEAWEVDDDNNIQSVQLVRNEADITASDSNTPDIVDFHAMIEDNHLWNIDYNKRNIKLHFTSIENDEHDHDKQYMYMSSVGFHFEDTTGSLSDILYVEIDDSFAPSFYNKDLASFNANNIHISLRGSMCHVAGMASMPECVNEDSPTGYNNLIELEVIFAESVDDFLDWVEDEFPDYFTSHEESFYFFGFYVRHYASKYDDIGIYAGTKDGELFIWDAQFGGLLQFGKIGPWLDRVPMHDHGESTDCPEGQHMMPDGMCMDNGMMTM